MEKKIKAIKGAKKEKKISKEDLAIMEKVIGWLAEENLPYLNSRLDNH